MERIHNTNKGVFDIFRFSKKIQNVPNIRKCFGIVGVFVKAIVIFNIGFGFVVFKSIW